MMAGSYSTVQERASGLRLIRPMPSAAAMAVAKRWASSIVPRPRGSGR